MPDFEARSQKGRLRPFSTIRHPTKFRFMKLLIRPAPEVAIKSKPVRRQQMRHLRQNIRKLLARLDPEIRVEGSWDRVDVEVPDGRGLSGPALELLLRIPGISTIRKSERFHLSVWKTLPRRLLRPLRTGWLAKPLPSGPDVTVNTVSALLIWSAPWVPRLCRHRVPVGLI